jgi:hypothetical protein
MAVNDSGGSKAAARKARRPSFLLQTFAARQSQGNSLVGLDWLALLWQIFRGHGIPKSLFL